MKSFKCPVCKKPLSQKEYESALGILGERERHLQHQREDLRTKLQVAKTKQKQARLEGIKAERSRTQRLLAGRDKQIQILKERVNQLKKGSTPQTEGLEFEEQLVARLRREFPGDTIQHTGKSGDIFHTVIHEKNAAGTIIYECKRSPRIDNQHIRQAYLAKQQRDANFAVLVTTGKKKGFTGFAEIRDVLVVSPLGTIALASLLRKYLIEMSKSNIPQSKRTIIAKRLLKHITSPQFANRIQGIIHTASELQRMVQQEAKEHDRTWRKRWKHYQVIHWDGSQVERNIQLVLHGKEPKSGVISKLPRLQLPPSSE